VITLLTGNPGHGKSYSSVKLIDETVHKGIPVATNVPLRDDWAHVMARRHTLFGRWRRQTVEAKAAQYARLVHVTDDLDELLRVRIAGKGEGRGRIVLDECHRWMNTRAWDQAPGLTRSQAIDQRLKVIAYVSGHRHYGLDVWLISQAEANVDAQVRSLYEFHTEVRNFRRLPLFGAIFRFNLFLAVTHWNDKANTKAGVSCYGLSKSLARLYDTHALEEHDWPQDAIVLPRPEALGALPSPEGGPGRDATGGSARPALPAADASRPSAPAVAHAADLGHASADGV
jgi:Zonular occludens toxin (Zot)